MSSPPAPPSRPSSAPGWRLDAGDPASRVLLHVPHGAVHLPPEVRAALVLSDADLEAELAAMTDRGTQELAAQVQARAGRRPWAFVNALSRLVVDPERFPDEREEMAAVGMGAVYTATHDRRQLRTPDPARDRDLVTRYFAPYAEALADLVDHRLAAHDDVVLLDLHSYPQHALPYELHQDDRRPQLCLGTDPGHTPAWLLQAAQECFADVDVACDQPFRGTYVPLRHDGTQYRVSSLMLEVRRDLPPDGAAMTAGLLRLVEAIDARD